MIGRRLLFAILLLPLAASPAAADAPLWRVEPGSRVGFSALQVGAPVEGVFETFEAEIRFSPDDLAGSRVAVTIDIASVNSESGERDEAIRGPGLLDVARFPTGRFEADGFVHKGGSDYEALGRLTLRDVTREVMLPFTLEFEKGQGGRIKARAKGELQILRLDYGVGQGIWQDVSVVFDEVAISIDILASRPGG